MFEHQFKNRRRHAVKRGFSADQYFDGSPCACLMAAIGFFLNSMKDAVFLLRILSVIMLPPVRI